MVIYFNSNYTDEYIKGKKKTRCLLASITLVRFTFFVDTFNMVLMLFKNH